MLKSLTVHGLRGFSKPETIRFALPNGSPGGGLTVILGPNNGGKTTIIEALSLFSDVGNPIPEAYRNSEAGFKVSTYLVTHDDKQYSFETRGTSTTATPSERIKMTAIPARRRFAPQFNNTTTDRERYASASTRIIGRNPTIEHFSYRLNQIQENIRNKRAFDSLLARVITPVPDWYIEHKGGGSYYMKLGFGNSYHDSEGLGEGLISLLFLIDALYDSEAKDVILIDEPELSLHPALQGRVFGLFKEFSAQRQIIYATHSPFFVDWDSIEYGGRLLRVYKDAVESRSRIAEIKTETWTRMQGLTKNINNPHILGLDARNALFLDDRVILVEGQEDVVCYKRICKTLNIKIQGDFFGWGVGGADNVPIIARMLTDLGYQHIAVILDNNKASLKEQLEQEFPRMKVYVIPTENVRDRKEKTSKAAEGITDERGDLKGIHKEAVKSMLLAINDKLNPKAV